MEDASAFYRIFCVSAILAFSLMIISLFQYLVWKTLPALVWALTFLEAGIIGNGLDKLRLGAVRDFIPVPLTTPPVYFNAADVFQILGSIAILAMIWMSPEKIWRKNELRSTLIIFPRSQLKVIGILILIVSLCEVGFFLLLTAYLRTNEVPFSFNEAAVSGALFLLLSLLIVAVFGLFWSHRMFGPFRAVERFIRAQDKSQITMRLSDDNECVREILILLKKQQSEK